MSLSSVIWKELLKLLQLQGWTFNTPWKTEYRCLCYANKSLYFSCATYITCGLITYSNHLRSYARKYALLINVLHAAKTIMQTSFFSKALNEGEQSDLFFSSFLLCLKQSQSFHRKFLTNVKQPSPVLPYTPTS